MYPIKVVEELFKAPMLLKYFVLKFFLWNKKWNGKCPDRIQRQVLENSYESGGLKATDMAALNSALKVKE